MMPGNRHSPARSRATRFSRTSSRTDRRLTRPAATAVRSSPRVEGLAEAIGHLISASPVKSQAPNPKLQIPSSKSQAPTTPNAHAPTQTPNTETEFEHWLGAALGIWALGMPWSLGFGAWDLTLRSKP